MQQIKELSAENQLPPHCKYLKIKALRDES